MEIRLVNERCYYLCFMRVCRTIGVIIVGGCFIYLSIITRMRKEMSFKGTNEIQQSLKGTTLCLPRPKTENETESNVKVLSHKKIIMLIAYMRSGSSFIGSVLQEFSGSFYVFEPIRAVDNAFSGLEMTSQNLSIDKTFCYLHCAERTQFTKSSKGAISKLYNIFLRKYTAQERNKVVLDEIHNWLTCRLDLLSIRTLMQISYTKSKVMGAFYKCALGLNSILNRRTQSTSIEKHYDIDSCLNSAIKVCKSARLLAIKFIRLKMKEIVSLLPLYPNLKVIHLVRDPRGIFYSMSRVGYVPEVGYQEAVQKHCWKVRDNLHYSKTIFQKYKNRLMILQYEKMAERPVETARAIAEFGGLECEEHLQEYIRSNTNAIHNSCRFCLQRKNSSKTASKWRTSIDTKLASYIDDACKSSNDILGYFPLTKSSIKDQTIPSMRVVDIKKTLLRSKLF